jgi:rhomboid protease GluP
VKDVLLSYPNKLRFWGVVFLIVLSSLPELALQGADWGLWGSARWRPLTYQNGAFWVGLLHGWQPNYAAQPYTMFVTYAFLHAGMAHLVFNMITLFSLGYAITLLTGLSHMMLIYGVSILGGAIGFGLLGTGAQSMVGASGALFGLAGAWVTWKVWVALWATPGPKTFFLALLWPITFLLVLNLIMIWTSSEQIAWETHLGGFLSGALTAALLLFFRHPRPLSQSD